MRIVRVLGVNLTIGFDPFSLMRPRTMGVEKEDAVRFMLLYGGGGDACAVACPSAPRVGEAASRVAPADAARRGTS